MATRTSQIIINVDDKSLLTVNDEIKALQKNINGLKIGTEEWNRANAKLGVLKDKFKEATTQAKELQGQIQKVSSSDQIRAVAKLGAGMVGAFAAVNGTLTALGISGNKTLEEITAKGVQLMQIFGGLNQVAELFSKQTINSLKGIGIGFKGLVTSVKGFSTATKAAIAGTGVGILLLLIGALIANWDKLTAAISRNRKERELAKEVEKSEVIIKNLETTVTLEEKRIADQKKLNELNGEAYKNSKLDYELAKQKADLEFERVNNLQLELQQLKAQEKEAIKKVDNLKDVVIQDALAQASITKNLKKREEELKVIQDSIALNKASYDQAAAAYLLQEGILNNINKEDAKRLLLEERIAKIAGLQDQVKILEAQGNKTNEIYLINQKINSLEILKLNDQEKFNGFLTEEEKIKLASLEADKKALKISNDRYFQQVKIDIQELKNQKRFDESFKRIKDFYSSLDTELQNLDQSSNVITDNIDIYNKLFSKLSEGFDNYTKLQKESINFDSKKNEIILKQILNQGNFTNITKLAGAEVEALFKQLATGGESFYDFSERFYEATLATRREFESLGISLKDVGKIHADNYLNAERQVTLIGMQNAAVKVQLEYLIDVNNKKKDVNNKQQEETNLLIANNDEILQSLYLIKQKEELQLKAATNIEEEKKALDDLAKTQSQINGFENDNSGLRLQNVDLAREQNALNRDNEQITNEIVDNNARSVAENQKITVELENQARTYKKLQDFVGKYNEEIQVTAQVIGQSFELVSAAFDRKAENIAEDINTLQESFDDMNATEEDRLSRLADLQEELTDANGQRYEDLLAQIKSVQAEEDANFISKQEQEAQLKKLENDKAEAEYKAAKWRKAQAIIDGLIQTALAVIKALPNVFLSVATGVLGAAGVATIATQKLPPNPESKKEGGFSQEGNPNEVAGILHKSEYVVPANIVKNPTAKNHINALESMRLKGYQTGGIVTPANNISIPGMEYEKLVNALTIAVSHLPNPQLNIVTFTEEQQKVNLTKSNSGLKK